MTAEAIILAAAVLGAVAYLGRFAWRAFLMLDALHGLVEHELKPNGGGSLHDKITRTEQNLAEHLLVTAEDQARLAAVERHLGL